MYTFNYLRFLKYVLAAVDYGSMRRVAQVIGVQESTVSRNISALEQRLDIQIFERHNGGVRLTEEGERWLESVRTHVDGLEDALTQTARRNRETDTLHVSLCAPVGQEFLLRLIDRFKKMHPKITIAIRDGSCDKQATAIRRRETDIAFMSNCCEIKSCSTVTIFEEGLSILLPENHRLALQETVTWDDLSGERLLVPTGVDGTYIDSCFIKWITSEANAPLVERCCASLATVTVKVQLGKGYTITGTNFAKGISIVGTIWRPAAGRNSSCSIKAVWLPSNPKRAVLNFIALAQNMTREPEENRNY